MQQAELMMVRDAQQILGLSRTMVLKLADSGALPVVLLMPNGTRIFRRTDVVRLATERKRNKKE